MKDPRDIIIEPHISEKSLREIEKNNRYTFKVARDANKIEISKAVEELFGVKVEKVNTIRVPGKERRMGVHRGYTPAWKKALVKLAEGDRIEIFEGM